MSIASTGRASRSRSAVAATRLHERPPHHSVDERRPEAALRAGAADRPAADHGDSERVDPVAEQAQHSGQQRQRREHRDDADEDRAEREAAQDRVGHEEHPEHREHEGDPAEEDGPARRRSGRDDRVDLLQPARALLPVAREDEERVVDPEGEAHAPRSCSRRRTRPRRPGRRAPSERPRRRSRGARAATGTRPATTAPNTSTRMISATGSPMNSSPFCRSSSESFSKSASAVRGAGDLDLEAVLPVLRLHEVDERGDLVASHHDRHHRRVAILRDERLVVRGVVALRVLDDAEPRGACAECAHLRLEGWLVDRVATRAHDHDLARSRLGREALADERRGLLRLWIARDVAVARERVP